VLFRSRYNKNLKDPEINQLMRNRLEEFRQLDEEQNQVLQGGIEKTINLAPSNILHNIADPIGAGINAPIKALKDKQTFSDAYNDLRQSLKDERENNSLAKMHDGLIDFLAYGKINPFKGANPLINLGLNSGLQGGLINTVESLKDKGSNLKENAKDLVSGALWGSGLGVGTQLGLNKLAKGMESPVFKDKLAGALEILTSVPKKYSVRALQEELKGKSILNGSFDEDTAYRPIGEKIRQAKSLIENKDYYNNEYYRLGQKAYKGMQEVYNKLTSKVDNSLKRLPTSEDFAEQFNRLGQKAYEGFNNKQTKLEQDIRAVLNEMGENPNTLDIQNLRNQVMETINSFSNGGDINPALETAGREIRDVKRFLGMLSAEEKPQALNDILSDANKKMGFYNAFDSEGENIALDLLSQQTGKAKEYLRMILKANNPQQAKQKAFETLMNEIETKPFDNLSIDGSRFYAKYPELFDIMQDSTTNKEFMTKLASRITGRDFKKYNFDNDPLASTIAEADNRFNKITNNLIENLQKTDKNSAYNKAFEDFGKNFGGIDESLKEEYMLDLMDVINKVENVENPQIKPIDLHNIKELLYDKANYDIANSGIRNNVLKALANDINSTLRSANSKYAQVNDAFKMLKDVEKAFGGSQGVNPNTIAGKLMSYGEKGNILSNMDSRLRNLDAMVDTPNKFFLDTKALKNRMNELDMLKDDIKSINPQLRMRALSQLDRLTNGGFYNDITNINNFESLGDYNPLQGNIVNAKNIASKMRGFGSETNTLRGADLTLKDIDSIVGNDYKFYDELKDLSTRHNEVKDILKEINAKSYEKHPKNLSNIQYTAGEEALDKLQKLSGINFMDDLEKTVSADALSHLFSGQQGGGEFG